MRRSYKFRLYPNKTQEAELQVWLDLCRDLYNGCLEIKRLYYKKTGKSPSGFDLMKQLPEVKKECSEYGEVNSQVLQQVIAKLEIAYRAFFRRIQNGETPGLPRFKGKKRYNSFTYPQASTTKWADKSVYLPCFGWIKWRPWRDLDVPEITPKTMVFKKEADGWYCYVSCVVEQPQPLEPTGKEIGLDLGLHHLVATSDESFLGDLDALKKQAKKIVKLQAKMDRGKKGSNQRKRAVNQFLRANQKLTRTKKYQLDCISRKLINENDIISIEDLDVDQLINKGDDSAQDVGKRRNFRLASLSTFTHMLTYKAEEAGRLLVKVDPKNTSQLCSRCGAYVYKDLDVRVHDCPHCGLVLDRDTNSAKEILARGILRIRGSVVSDACKVPPAPAATLSCDDWLDRLPYH